MALWTSILQEWTVNVVKGKDKCTDCGQKFLSQSNVNVQIIFFSVYRADMTNRKYRMGNYV